MENMIHDGVDPAKLARRDVDELPNELRSSILRLLRAATVPKASAFA
jgi:hypothetical protein